MCEQVASVACSEIFKEMENNIGEERQRDRRRNERKKEKIKIKGIPTTETYGQENSPLNLTRIYIKYHNTF